MHFRGTEDAAAATRHVGVARQTREQHVIISSAFVLAAKVNQLYKIEIIMGQKDLYNFCNVFERIN